MSKIFNKGGYTVLEMMMVVAIMVILVVIIWSAFVGLNRSQVLDKATKQVASLIVEARNLTLDSKNDSQYGVHFETSKAILFKGTVYSAGASDNVTNDMPSKVTITGINLSGGGSEVVFKKLTGATTNSGTVTLTNSINSTSKVITISGTGLVSGGN